MMNTLVVFKRQTFEFYCRLTVERTDEVLHQLEWESIHDPSNDLPKLWILKVCRPPKTRICDQSNNESLILHVAITLRSGNEDPRALSFSLTPKLGDEAAAPELITLAIHIHDFGITVQHGR